MEKGGYLRNRAGGGQGMPQSTARVRAFVPRCCRASGSSERCSAKRHSTAGLQAGRRVGASWLFGGAGKRAPSQSSAGYGAGDGQQLARPDALIRAEFADGPAPGAPLVYAIYSVIRRAVAAADLVEAATCGRRREGPRQMQPDPRDLRLPLPSLPGCRAPRRAPPPAHPALATHRGWCSKSQSRQFRSATSR